MNFTSIGAFFVGGSVLPASGLAVLKDPDVVRINPHTADFGLQPLGWLSERLLREIERAPVNPQKTLCPQVSKNLERLFRSDMCHFHDGRRHICADGDGS